MLAVFAYYYKYEHHLAELVASKLSEEAFSSTRVSDGSSETYEACRLSPRKHTTEEPYSVNRLHRRFTVQVR